MSRTLIAFEQVVQIAQRKCAKLVGFCGATRDAGATTCAALAAATAARSGFKVLLMDFSRGSESPDDSGWYPGVPQSKISMLTSIEGFDFIQINTAGANRYSFNKLNETREALLRDFYDYQMIFVDLPPQLEIREGAVNAIAAAALCEVIFLICCAGVHSRGEMVKAVDRLRTSGCQLEGIILNEHQYRTPGQEIAARASGLFRFFPGFAARASRAALRSELLN
jgi:cellulose biosynthesis protein BcsQ